MQSVAQRRHSWTDYRGKHFLYTFTPYVSCKSSPTSYRPPRSGSPSSPKRSRWTAQEKNLWCANWSKTKIHVPAGVERFYIEPRSHLHRSLTCFLSVMSLLQQPVFSFTLQILTELHLATQTPGSSLLLRSQKFFPCFDLIVNQEVKSGSSQSLEEKNIL